MTVGELKKVLEKYYESLEVRYVVNFDKEHDGKVYVIARSPNSMGLCLDGSCLLIE